MHRGGRGGVEERAGVSRVSPDWKFGERAPGFGLTSTGGETFVLERGGRQLAGVGVKAGATVVAADFRGLRKLAGAARRRFACGVVLYDGETSASFGDRLHTVPIRRLREH